MNKIFHLGSRRFPRGADDIWARKDHKKLDFMDSVMGSQNFIKIFFIFLKMTMILARTCQQEVIGIFGKPTFVRHVLAGIIFIFEKIKIMK